MPSLLVDVPAAPNSTASAPAATHGFAIIASSTGIQTRRVTQHVPSVTSGRPLSRTVMSRHNIVSIRRAVFSVKCHNVE